MAKYFKLFLLPAGFIVKTKHPYIYYIETCNVELEYMIQINKSHPIGLQNISGCSQINTDMITVYIQQESCLVIYL